MLPSQLRDRVCPGEDLDGQVLPLRRQESLGRPGGRDGARSDCVKPREDVAWQSMPVFSVLVVGLRAPPNMEETGIWETPIRSTACYLTLNQAG